MTGTTTLTRERADLIESLRRHRGFLRFTVQNLTDEQAKKRPTVSALNLAGVLADYEEVGAHTDKLVTTIDLDSDHALPDAPWFEPGARWSARRVFLHVIAETSQHAGHADILRESIDGQKTMG
jgi:hypothetical protein